MRIKIQRLRLQDHSYQIFDPQEKRVGRGWTFHLRDWVPTIRLLQPGLMRTGSNEHPGCKVWPNPFDFSGLRSRTWVVGRSFVRRYTLFGRWLRWELRSRHRVPKNSLSYLRVTWSSSYFCFPRYWSVYYNFYHFKFLSLKLSLFSFCRGTFVPSESFKLSTEEDSLLPPV